MRVYVAGSYNADNVINVLDNMRIGMQAGKDVLLAGHSPFVPWFDYHFQLMLKDNEQLTIDDYYRYSMDWLKVSDIVYVCNYRKESIGTKAEIQMAEKMDIPVIYDINNLKKF